MITIKPFETRDLEPVAEILGQSFAAKLGTLSKLKGIRLTQYILDCGFVGHKKHPGYFVAQDQNQIVGVVELKSLLFQSPEFKPSIFAVLRRYGVIKTCRTLASMVVLKPNPKNKECYIEHIAVLPQAQGLGVGGLLLRKAQQFACSLPGCECLSLDVAQKNTKAIRLYKEFGFTIRNSQASYFTQMMLGIKNWHYMEWKVRGSNL